MARKNVRAYLGHVRLKVTLAFGSAWLFGREAAIFFGSFSLVFRIPPVAKSFILTVLTENLPLLRIFVEVYFVNFQSTVASTDCFNLPYLNLPSQHFNLPSLNSSFNLPSLEHLPSHIFNLPSLEHFNLPSHFSIYRRLSMSIYRRKF